MSSTPDQTPEKPGKLTSEPAGTEIPGATPPSAPYTKSQEKARVLVEGINHSILHNLTFRAGVLYGIINIRENLLPPNFTKDVTDPRPPSPHNFSWKSLTSAEKLEVLATAVVQKARDIASANYETVTFDQALSMFKSMGKVLTSLGKALEKVDNEPKKENQSREWRDSDEGKYTLACFDMCKRIVNAQLVIAEPPSYLPPTSLPDLVNHISTRFVVGEKKILVEQDPDDPYAEIKRHLRYFIEPGEFPKKGGYANVQADCLLRIMADQAVNSLKAATIHEQEPNPEIDKEILYRLKISVKNLPDGRTQLIMEDNCGGIPEEYLKPDGDMDRLLLCNRSTSSKGGGVGNCELYYIAKALKAELHIENYMFDPEIELKGARITLTFPKVTVLNPIS
jgi:hypothetical protein